MILMSPYTSIKSIAKDKVGGFFCHLMGEHFDNLSLISKVTCPTFLVHGQKDTLIGFQHSQRLHDACGGQTTMILPTEMTHNDFDFYNDLIKPLLDFARQINMNTLPNERLQKVIFNEGLYIPPDMSIDPRLVFKSMNKNAFSEESPTAVKNFEEEKNSKL